MPARSRKWWWIGGGVVVAMLAVVVVAPWVYINFIKEEAAPKPEFSPTPETTAPGATRAPLTGTWTVGRDSHAQYRVKEVLFGQDTEATGTTNDVSGSVEFDATGVTAATVEVDLTTVKSGEGRRDAQFHGRIMNTAQFPDAIFNLTQPIALASEPADGETIIVPATGELTVHGVTNTATAALEAKRTGNTIEVLGEIPVVFADYGIDDPSGGPATVVDNGLIEFRVVLTPA
jgi:polyisoprenoid-binding protein YceI